MSYSDFAKYYDILTDNVDYNDIAYYYSEILHRYGVKRGKLLDLGCGTGNLTIRLERLGFSDITGCDLSQDMLNSAVKKSDNIKWLCSDMRELIFRGEKGEKGEFDAVIATLDSINHLKDNKAVGQAFDSVYGCLKKGGIFAADLNTPYKHRYILADNVFTFDCEEEGLYCVWENERAVGDPLDRIDMFLEFFERQDNGSYIRTSDSLSEIAIPPEEITQMLVKSGFRVLECSEYLTGRDLEETSEKFTVIAKK